jgi:hypothetical protein
MFSVILGATNGPRSITFEVDGRSASTMAARGVCYGVVFGSCVYGLVALIVLVL